MGRRGRNNLTEESIFFITTTVVNFTPIFENTAFCDILINNIKYYKTRYKFEILGYVIMLSHFHWIVRTEQKRGTVSDIMRDIKKFTAWKIFGLIEKENLKELENHFIKAAEGIKDQSRKLWMSRFDDEVIRNEKMFWVKSKYIHDNPVKAGIVVKPEEYKY
ncbi:MAG: hypothetical protein GXX85_17660 [Ignavibacteria bacterium]|nr:hypothetical protein [Ignavibacteria bacterium]